MFQRFTDGMRQVLAKAQDEAHQFGHTYIGSDHLLLGLLRCSQGEVAEQVLAERGLTLESVCKSIEDIVGRPGRPSRGRLPLTAGAQRVLRAAGGKAVELRHNRVGTAHLLLAFLDEGEGVGPTILFRLLDLERSPRPNRAFTETRRRVVQLLHLR